MSDDQSDSGGPANKSDESKPNQSDESKPNDSQNLLNSPLSTSPKVPTNASQNSPEDQSSQSKPIPLKDMIDDLEKQKRQCEYVIRVSSQAKECAYRECKREIDMRRDMIRQINESGSEDAETRREIHTLQKEINGMRARTRMEIIEIEREIGQKMIEMGDIDCTIQNNWGKENARTVTKWITESNKQNFVYERVREILQERFKKLTLTLMIISGMRSLLDVSNFGISEADYPYVALGFKIGMTILGFITLVITCYIKVEKFEDIIQSYTSYIERLENFLASLISITDIKRELRPDGDTFVYQNRETYAAIYRDSPYITQENLTTGNKDYKDYVLNVDPEKQLHCSRKRANYANFALSHQESDEKNLDRSGRRPMIEGVQETLHKINRDLMDAFDDSGSDISDLSRFDENSMEMPTRNKSISASEPASKSASDHAQPNELNPTEADIASDDANENSDSDSDTQNAAIKISTHKRHKRHRRHKKRETRDSA